ncbi:putative enzyme related to lactoylglutathione lyase [Kitasatospora sp. MAA4]|uniref:VOC family protein n=1 Tax=Kitasatospora sp. MAA4 TaxID=3035093 RepID=UPI0024749782|nr:VOC family protein [Kitasatospora sp. MAA4]MDH6137762.1 putative enzyme related to lactoylglutathione lyase [Kitasatospora sp. MAA4]
MPVVTSPYTPGTPCWIDLMVPDQQAALDFYRDLFGWQGEVGPPETGGYAVCTLNGKAVAGIMTAMAPEGQPTPPTAWTTYLATADADATTAAITRAGGAVLMPGMDVMTIGRMAVVAEPSGAVFGLWEAKDFSGAQVVNEPGSVVWNELLTGDTAAAAKFCSAALGIEASPMEGAEGYFSLSAGGRVVGGMQGLGQLPPGTPPHWLAYFSVDDTDSTVDALIRAGGNVLKPPFDMVAGRMAVVQDPQGATFALINATGPELP